VTVYVHEKTVSQLVLERMEQEGWRQGHGGTVNGPKCLLGTVGVVTSYRQPVMNDTVYRWAAMLPGDLHDIIFSHFKVMKFNDDPNTTFQDVKDFLEKFIAFEKYQEGVVNDEFF